MRMNVSDENLAKAAGLGDKEAFLSLITRHYDRLFQLAFRLTGSKADAEDLTQDVCAALPAKLRGFQGQSRFSTWVYRVVVNAAHDRRRRMAAHQKAADGWGDWETNRQEENKEAREASDWLSRAMQQLSPDLRDTLALTLEEELTHKEAGEILGVSEGTVSWRMTEVKRRLRDMHEEERAG
jgi:RNA polymerase sigma-70 factor (ECF subfamily)